MTSKGRLRNIMNKHITLAALTALALVSAQAHAIDWPIKPLAIYVTTAAGGDTDLMARMAAEYAVHKRVEMQ